MRCVDTSFCVDLCNGEEGALSHAATLDAAREQLAIPAPALTEFLMGAFAKGGRRQEAALRLAARLEVLPIDEGIALEAARMGGHALHAGRPIGTIDLLIAATARLCHCPLITRDGDFATVPGLAIETY